MLAEDFAEISRSCFAMDLSARHALAMTTTVPRITMTTKTILRLTLLAVSLSLVFSGPLAAETPKNTLDLNWSYALAGGNYKTLQNASIPLALQGAMISMYRGIDVPNAPGLSIGLEPSVLFCGGQDYASLANQNWSVATTLLGPALQAKYKYRFLFGGFSLEAENGFGVAYLFEQVQWQWTSQTNPNIGDNLTVNSRVLEPVIEFGLNAMFKTSETSSLGGSLGLWITPINLDRILVPFIVHAGFTYQVGY
jgi:hypothetical protein